jgi:hypothetical protein
MWAESVVVEQAVFLFVAFDDAEPAVVVGHGGGLSDILTLMKHPVRSRTKHPGLIHGSSQGLHHMESPIIR